MYTHCAFTCSRLCANNLTSVTSFDRHNDPLETVIIESDRCRTDPKGLPVIPHKETEEWGVQIQITQNSKLLLFATILFCLFMLSTQKN